MERLKIERPEQGQRVLQNLYQDITRRITASPNGMCPVDMTLNFVRTAHAQSCGKCTPCRAGLEQIEKMIRSIMYGDAEDDVLSRIRFCAEVIRDTADCAIGYETAEMVLQALSGFRDDFEEHLQRGKCAYGTRQAIPCTATCPAHVDVPGYIALIKAGRYEDAVRLIRKDNPFPSVCGYVCEHPCENKCRRAMVDAPVNICGLKRYAVDHAGFIPTPPCAGGMLRYGIPDYRLPQDILDRDIQYILNTGVEAWYNIVVGEDVQIEELKQEFDAVYVSIGAHDHRSLGIEGENGTNVISAVEMLRGVGEGRIPDMRGKSVVVVGGGNVAMDATRTSLRLGASKVICAYRRRIEDMTALPEEVQEAQAEGADIRTLMAPDHIELDENGKVRAFWAQPQIISAVQRGGRTGVRSADKPAVRIPSRQEKWPLTILTVSSAITIRSRWLWMCRSRR